MPVDIVKDDGRVRIQAVNKAEADGKYQTHVYNTWHNLKPIITEQLNYHFSKHEVQRLDVPNWNIVITEENGEVAQAYLHGDYEEAKHEIAQTIACYVRLYNEIERKELGLQKQEKDWYTEAV
jgi:hypothetical protein